jgi:hypothetical protein
MMPEGYSRRIRRQGPAISIPANIAGLLGWFRLTVLATPGKPLQAGLFESGLAGLADRRTTALVFVVGGDIADSGVQPHAVVALPDQRELGAQPGRVTDGVQVRPFGLDVAERWQVDETCVKVAGQWRYVYRAVDQFGQVIDVFVTRQRDAAAAHRFFQRAMGATKVSPVEVTTDRAPVYPAVLEERPPAAWHRTDRYANNRIECDHVDTTSWPSRSPPTGDWRSHSKN